MAHQANQQTMQLSLSVTENPSGTNSTCSPAGPMLSSPTRAAKKPPQAVKPSKKPVSTLTSATLRASSARSTPSTSCSAKWIVSGCPSSNPGSSTSATTARCRVSTRPMPRQSTATNRCSSGAAPSTCAHRHSSRTMHAIPTPRSNTATSHPISCLYRVPQGYDRPRLALFRR